MKSKKICTIVSEHNLGNHFLHWTIEYLSGKSIYYNFNKNEYEDLLMNPLNRTKCHDHSISAIRGFEELKKYNLNDDNNNIQVSNMYLLDVINHYIHKDISCLSKDDMKDIRHIMYSDLDQCINYMYDKGFTFIYLYYDKRDVLTKFYNNRHHVDHKSNSSTRTVYKNMDEYMINYESDFFNSSKKQFTTDNIWDIREKYALNIMPFNVDLSMKDALHFPEEYFEINSIDMVDNLDIYVRKLFSFCNMEIDKIRFNKWNNIYKEWKKVHDNKFSHDFWKIIDAIVDNKDMNLSVYNIDFYKEVLILYGLMYKYNLNIQSWELEKFPTNARLINELLEDNIHPRPMHFDDFYHPNEYNDY